MRPGDLLEQRYRLVRVLGRGRSGSVWCARNELIDRAVAIKILHRSLASDTERLQRFFQEARACGRVRHPAVVEVLDLGQGDDGVLFLVMELLEGETLSSLLARKGSLGVDETLSIMIPLARGLGAAHAHGILHRDLKPANIYLHKTPTGGLQPKILDFGISKILGSDLTQSGVVLGTPSYMSPEQARGVPDLDPRMDVWSLGVIAYECLAGRLPFTSREYRTLVEEILDKKHTPIAELASDVPIDLQRVIDEALEKSRERRLPSAAALAQKLTAILRARGSSNLLHEPDDEFSDGAPTLAQDRDFGTKPAIDDTVGDGLKLPVAKPVGPKPARDKEKVRPAAGTPIAVQPTASTAALAAQTAGSKRVERVALPRPAAGTPARRTDPGMPGPEATSTPAEAPAAQQAQPTKPSRAATLAWETSIGKAASGREDPAREEMSTEEPRPVSAAQAASIASARIRVDDQWDTTVADVAQDEMEKGDAPLAARRGSEPPTAGSEPEAVARPARKPALEMRRETVPEVPYPNLSGRANEAPNKGGAGASYTPMGAIPGFTTAAPGGAKKSAPPPKPSRSPPALSRQRTLPPGGMTQGAPSAPPPRAAAVDDVAQAPTKSKPPRPPPKSLHPGRNTLRPQGEGFAMARSSGPASDAPLIAPELFALNDPPPPAPAASVATSGPVAAPAYDTASAAPPSSGERPSIPAVGPHDNLEDTDRRARSALPIVPILAAAVAVVFLFGAVIGTVAARSRAVDPRVRRFANAEMIIIAWHDRSIRVDTADADAHAKADAETARLAALKEAEEKAAADAAASASASAAPSATVATPPPKAPPTSGWKPSSTSGKPKLKPKPKATTTAKPGTEAPTPTKKKGEKEWWEKKF